MELLGILVYGLTPVATGLYILFNGYPSGIIGTLMCVLPIAIMFLTKGVKNGKATKSKASM